MFVEKWVERRSHGGCGVRTARPREVAGLGVGAQAVLSLLPVLLLFTELNVT